MDFPLPPVGEGLFEVELVRWLVSPGDRVARGQGLMEVLSDKATMEVPAPFAGTVTALAADAGTKVAVGQVVLSYTDDAAASGRREPTVEAMAVSVAPAEVQRPQQPAHADRSPNGTLPPAAPSVRQLARKLGVDLAAIRGSGPHGRILLDDLTPFLTRPTAAAPPKPQPPPLDLGRAGTVTKLAGLRRTIADRMAAAKRHIPHYSYVDECDFTDLVRVRDQLRPVFAATGVKLTFLAFVVKAVARALKDVPAANGTFDETTQELTLHDRYHVGVAVAAPAGLVVPVVRDADTKDVATIARDIDRLASEAKAGRPRADDLKGGTFTVTSVGNVGGLISTPIINHPQVAILGVGKVVRRPVYDAAGAIKPADVAYLSFSFDHRVIDGAVGATFGNAVLKHLQAPATLLLPEGVGGGR